jgi:hypothetical protein
LLLVNGNPLENIDLISDPANNFLVIMKDGEVFKVTVPGNQGNLRECRVRPSLN